MANSKSCPKCGEIKNLHDFYPDKSKKEGVSSYCRSCQMQRSREKYHANPEAHKDRMAEWQRRNGHIRKAWRWRDKLAMIKAYGGRCACCGEIHPEFLTIDHVGGWGKEHRTKSGYGYNMVAYMKKMNYPQDGTFRLLCFNCNCSLGMFGHCPHGGLDD